VPGSSEWFSGGVVAYSNELKQKFLAVDNGLIAEYGAVSVPVARAMVEGIAASTAARVAVSVTGIAGPSGGTEEKPVGTVFYGVFVNGTVTDHHFTFSGSRKEIQEITAQTALDLVRRTLLKHKGVNNGGSN
jgi:nicotinamide-nucleotide amidase